MIDLTTRMEQKIMDLLNTIDGEEHGSYKYYTTTGTVDVYDEALSLALNTSNKKTNHTIKFDDIQDTVFTDVSWGQHAYTANGVIEIRSRVHNVGDEGGNVKNAIRQKLNEALSDLLYCFAQDYILDGEAELIRIASFKRTYDTTNNRIQSGVLITRWSLIYTMDMLNPRIPACY